MSKTELRKLAEFVQELSWNQIPEEVKETVTYRVLDLVSASMGAVKDELVHSVADSYEERNGLGSVSVWGYQKKYQLSTAAMLNAMLAHTLELDDVHPGSKTHGSASLIPAAWSLAEYLGSTGEAFLTAVVAGYEVVSRVGMALGVSPHRNQGWHATSTCGVFGVAAACSKLLHLNLEETISALGMAGTQSAGVWAFLGDGSNCKILHTGRAASNGIESAFFARAGMTGPEHILEGEDGGLLKAMSDEGDASKLSAGLGEVYEIQNMDIKPYPCCRSAHAPIDAALKLRKEMSEAGLSISDIEKIHIETYLVGYKQCAVSEGCLHPTRPMDAKFSTPYSVAVALRYGKVTAEEFLEERVGEEETKDLMGKTKVEATERFTSVYPAHWGCSMKILTKDGREFYAEIEDPSGSVKRPLTREEAMQKARALIQVAYPGREEEIMQDILGLPQKERLPQW